MPDHTTNNLQISGPLRKRRVFTREIHGNNGVLTFDNLITARGVEERVERWGTKWEPYTESDNVVLEWIFNERYQEIQFSTAWDPPTQFFFTVSFEFPQLMFRLEYSVRNEAGIMIFKGGRILQDDYYDDFDDPEAVLIRERLGISDEDET